MMALVRIVIPVQAEIHASYLRWIPATLAAI